MGGARDGEPLSRDVQARRPQHPAAPGADGGESGWALLGIAQQGLGHTHGIHTPSVGWAAAAGSGYACFQLMQDMRAHMAKAGFEGMRTLPFPQPCYPTGWWSVTLARKAGGFDFRDGDDGVAGQGGATGHRTSSVALPTCAGVGACVAICGAVFMLVPSVSNAAVG